MPNMRNVAKKVIEIKLGKSVFRKYATCIIYYLYFIIITFDFIHNPQDLAVFVCVCARRTEKYEDLIKFLNLLFEWETHAYH